MTKTDRSLQTFQRRGDGFPIKVTREVTSNPDGTQGVVLSLDLSDAYVPEKKYLANVAAVHPSDHGFMIAFGQRRDFGKGLRSLVQIKMSAQSVTALLETCKRILDQLMEQIRLQGLPDRALTEIDEEPPQTVAMFANVVAVATSEMDACMDFYALSAFSLGGALQGQSHQVGLEPILRVTLDMPLMVALLTRLKDISTAATSRR